MKTQIHPPEAPGGLQPARDPRRRWRQHLALIFVALLLLVAQGINQWLLRGATELEQIVHLGGQLQSLSGQISKEALLIQRADEDGDFQRQRRQVLPRGLGGAPKVSLELLLRCTAQEQNAL